VREEKIEKEERKKGEDRRERKWGRKEKIVKKG
jgi:hypothetical protein